MRRIHWLLLVLVLIPLMTTTAQNDGTGISVTCPDGTQITNGVEVIVNMRPGFVVTATALGVDGLDPIMAVMDRGVVRSCSDDNADAATFSADLPTTGTVSASDFNAQIRYSHSYSGFEDVSIVVGGFGGTDGEFLLLLEGMAVTELDGEGDPFTLRLTENMTGADSTVYMLAVTDALDPLLKLIDTEGNTIFSCDDAGDPDFCEDENSMSLASSYVSRTQNRQTPGGAFDAMVTLPTSTMTDMDYASGLFFNFVMSSFELNTTGDYIVGFNVVIGDGNSQAQATEEPTEPPNTAQTAGVNVPGGGIDVSCPDGTQLTNGVEVVVNMRPGFTYTATALGVAGFDPVIAVLDQGQAVACEDDSTDAGTYSANLPTTGGVASSGLNAQMPFSHSYSELANVSIVVGGFEGQPGEFVLLLEGMAVTDFDGEGDPFGVRVMPNMVNADTDLSVYMLEVDSGLDSLLKLTGADGNVLAECDDGGSVCEEGTFDLASTTVSRTRNRTTTAAAENAMLTIPTTGFTDLDFSSELYLNFLMTSFGGTQGEYVVAFHFAVAEPVPEA